MPDERPDYLTVREVADLYRVSISALYTQRYRSEPPGVLGRKVGRRLLWKRSELDAWWTSQQERAGS
jgi:hypothetical protein